MFKKLSYIAICFTLLIGSSSIVSAKNITPMDLETFNLEKYQTIKAASSKHYEFEGGSDNSTSDKADSISFYLHRDYSSFIIVGALSSTDTVDWYKFTPKNRNTSFNYLITDISIPYVPHMSYKLSIYDSNMNLRGEKLFDLKNPTYDKLEDILLPCDKSYYIKMEYLNGPAEDPYQIYIDIKQRL